MSKIQCLTCGGMAEVGDKLSGTCPYCGCRVAFRRIASFNAVRNAELGKLKELFEAAKRNGDAGGDDPESDPDLALALCYLKTGNFTLAKKKLAALLENSPECAEAYYYYAVVLINGRPLAELTMREAKLLTEYLRTAMAIDGDFVFPRLLYALLCIEYYDANDLRAPDDGEQILDELFEQEVDPEELAFFKSLVTTETI